MMMPSLFGDNLFDDFLDDVVRPAKHAAKYLNPIPSVMKTDIKENEKGYTLLIDLPGYSKENIKAELKDGYLVVSAESNVSNDETDEDGKFIRRERLYGSCSRNFYVGKDITKEDINAKFESGLLKLFVPKKEHKEALPEEKYISIEG